MSSDKDFVTTDNRAEQGDLLEYESNVNAGQEDKAAAESEDTGKISKDEVEGLKDSLSGGEALDESEGYTRSSNKDAHPMKGEEELDAKIDAATQE